MKVLVVGAGSIGRRHLGNLRQLGISELLLYDPNPAAREHAAREFSLSPLESYEAALASRPQAVILCTPNHLHLIQAKEFLNQGAHLFIEKPLATGWEGVESFVSAVRETRQIVFVGYCMRFHPAVQRIKREIDGGRIGIPWLARARFGHYLPNWRPGQDYRQTYSAQASQGGGILFDAIHDIDYLLWWTSDKVREVTGWACHTSNLEIDTEDYASVLLRFQNGGSGEIRLDYLRHEKLREAEIIGPKGMLLWTSRGKNPEHVQVQFWNPDAKRYELLYENPVYDPNTEYFEEMKHFLACVRGEEIPCITLEEAADSLSVVLQAKKNIVDRNAGKPLASTR